METKLQVCILISQIDIYIEREREAQGHRREGGKEVEKETDNNLHNE